MEKFDKSNPYNPNTKPQAPKKAVISFLIFVVVAVFIVVKCGCSNDEENKVKTYDKIDALTHAQIYIKSKLKSPASAEFEGGADGVIKINDTTFTVMGTVDSQNSFGAMLRSNYSCKVIFHPKTDTHDIENVIIQ